MDLVSCTHSLVHRRPKSAQVLILGGGGGYVHFEYWGSVLGKSITFNFWYIIRNVVDFHRFLKKNDIHPHDFE